MPLLRRPAPSPGAESPFLQRRAEDHRPVVLVSLLCAAEAVRERSVAFHARRPRHRTIFVVTDPAIGSIRAAGFVAEHLPAPEVVRRVAARGDWRDYLLLRWATIRAKWSPDVVLTEALGFEEYLLECGLSGKISSS